jgi:hypothetical protein
MRPSSHGLDMLPRPASEVLGHAQAETERTPESRRHPSPGDPLLPEADEATAYKWLQDERARIKSGGVVVRLPKPRFADFAVSLLERKIQKGELKTKDSRERWAYTLEHLIGGTTGPKTGLHVAGFGEMFVDRITPHHVELWRERIQANLIANGDYSPKWRRCSVDRRRR